MIRRFTALTALALLTGLAPSRAAAQITYFEPRSFRLHFEPEEWEQCALLLLDQARAANEDDGVTLSFQWFDFSPLTFPMRAGPLPSQGGNSIPNTVDVQVVNSKVGAVRFYNRTEDRHANYFPQAEHRRYVVYEDMLGYLGLSAKSPGIREGFTWAERKLPLERSEIGLVELVRPGVIDALSGSVRIYDATKSHYASSPASPAELMYKARNMSAWSIEQLRARDPDVELYEIGNWLIASETRSNTPVPPRVRLRTKVMLLKMLLEKVVKRSPTAKFLFHVATRKHRRSYEIDYGAKMIQSDPIPGSEELETLLLVEAGPFAGKLQKKIDELLGYLGEAKP